MTSLGCWEETCSSSRLPDTHPRLLSPKKTKTRDLRLDDNPALMAALRAGREVVPLFIWAPDEEGVFTPGLCSRWWLHKSLRALSAKLAALVMKGRFLVKI